MSGFPDFLYRLTPRDEQVTPLEILNLRLTASTAATDVATNIYTVPLGKVLVCSAYGLRGEGGAAQYSESLWIEIYTDPTMPTLLGGSLNAYPSAAQRSYSHGVASQIIVPEGWQLRGRGTFSAGAAANNVFLGINGILIPRGNFAI